MYTKWLEIEGAANLNENGDGGNYEAIAIELQRKTTKSASGCVESRKIKDVRIANVCAVGECLHGIV